MSQNLTYVHSVSGNEKALRMTFSRKKKTSLQLELLEHRNLMTADVFISEFSASNDLVLADEDGDFPDWIEIYNAGPDSVNLDGWHLTDDAEELNKWSFPAQELNPGNFLVVYASDKDRSEVDSPLHTNFRLSTAGEYLALTQDTDVATVEVVSEFAPEFPIQFTDVSYGRAQGVTETVILPPTAPAKIFTPTNNALGTAWTSPSFNDNAWTDGTAAVGYQTTVPGFTVHDAKSTGTIQNLTNAISLLNGTAVRNEATAITPVVNFYDTDGGGGGANFNNDLDFPNDSAADDNDFAIRATGTIVIPNAGTWTFGVNSDDGSRLTIGGQTVINDNTLHAPRDTFGQVSLSAGEHDVELIFFERGGGAEVELFAASGARNSFSSAFELVGDVANGGLPVFTSPNGTATGFGSNFSTDVGDSMLGLSTDIFVRVPFNVADPTSLETLTLRMNYDDGFVAYLNGTEVARRNAPDGVVPANASATIDRPRIESGFAEAIDITPFLDSLTTGENVLAIHGLNDAIDSGEFLIRAELAEVSVATGDLLYFPEPTPRAFNPSTGVEGFLTDEVSFNVPHGFQEEAFLLSMTALSEGTTIRYTTDGSEPDSRSPLYSGPITIDSTTTIRARAFKDGLDPSFVETATYLFISDIVEQDRGTAVEAGFPNTGSINGQRIDYGIDPDIANSPTWGPQLGDALTQIPSLSIVLDGDALFDSDDGIFVNAGSHGREWERPASLELINPDGVDGFQVDAGIRIRGGFSRSGNNPKHSFRLFFRDEYGDSSLEYPLFGDEGASAFDKIDLRTTQNYSWAFQGDDDNAFVRDVFSRDLQRELGQPYTRSRYYHLYLNGQYWGLFQTQERAEARFAASYYGGDEDDYDVVKSTGSSGGYQNEATDGTLEAYERLAAYFYQTNGLSNANFDDYMRAQGKNPDGTDNPEFERLLDVENLIDYAIITYFTGDRDGPASRFVAPRVNNYFAILNREDPDGFKFFEHDSEHSLDTGENNMVSPFTTGGSQFRYFNPHWMHQELANSNTEYLTQFMDRVTELTFNGGLLTPEVTTAMIDSRAAEFDTAIIAESARWGDAQRTTPHTKTTWEAAVNRTKSWLEDRGPVFLNQLRAVGWYPDANPPQFRVNESLQHGGDVDSTDNITIDTTATLDFNRRLISDRATWSYLDDGSDQGTAWREPNFDDSDWESGRAELGYGDGTERTELSFGSNSRDKHITTYFRRTFTISEPDFVAVNLQLLRDDGAVVYLNGEEVVRSNLPAGDIGFDTRANATVGGSSETEFFDFAIDPSLIQPGVNTVAVEIHQVSPTSSDISFDLELRGAEDEGAGLNVLYTTDGSDPRLAFGEANPEAIQLTEQGFFLNNSGTVSARSLVSGEWGPLVSAQFNVASVGLAGDLNNDSQLTSADIDILLNALNTGDQSLVFDLDASGDVNEADRTFMVETIFRTLLGDTDLDRDVDFADFLILSSNFGSTDTGWAQGNFNGDADTGFADFLMLSANFGLDAAAADELEL